MERATRITTIAFTPSQYAALKAVADREQRSVGGVIRVALSAYLNAGGEAPITVTTFEGAGSNGGEPAPPREEKPGSVVGAPGTSPDRERMD